MPLILSSTSLSGEATGSLLVPAEPYLSPLGGLEAGIVSDFGKRDIPASSTSMAASTGPKMEMHDGIDYGVPPGTDVFAARSGKVIFAGFSKMYVSRIDKKVQNRFVIIRHADGQSTRYVHLSGLHVRPGQDVRSGQLLGVVSESDEWTQPVFHFEIRNLQGKAIKPETMITRVKKR